MFCKRMNDNEYLVAEKSVAKKLEELGASQRFKGYEYLKYAIAMVATDVKWLDSVTKQLYPEIASKYNTTTVGVNSAITRAIEYIWENGNLSKLNQIFGYTSRTGTGHPSNSEFIAMIAARIRDSI